MSQHKLRCHALFDRNRGLLALHRLKEFFVRLSFFKLVSQELNSGGVFHAVQQFAQDPHALQFIIRGKQLFPARARATNIDGWDRRAFQRSCDLDVILGCQCL